MRIHYPTAIQESVEELRTLEQQQRGTKLADRVRCLRLLKSGEVAELGAAAHLVGYRRTQATRWWALSRHQGLATLLTPPVIPGRPARLTAEARAGLRAQMVAGAIRTLEQARQYLRAVWSIDDASINGVW